jgi:DNA-binding transcriptional MerR regulator
MYEAGYRIYNEYDFINQQSFIIFIKKWLSMESIK